MTSEKKRSLSLVICIRKEKKHILSHLYQKRKEAYPWSFVSEKKRSISLVICIRKEKKHFLIQMTKDMLLFFSDTND
jgi:hypothetical protein